MCVPDVFSTIVTYFCPKTVILRIRSADGPILGRVNTTVQNLNDAEARPWYTHSFGTAMVLLITGLVGLGATLVLTYERIQLWLDADYVTSCDLSVWVSCGTVMQSWQAALFGFPNQFIGIIGFAVVITLGMAILGGGRFANWWWHATSIGLGLALVFCLWLWIQAVYVINTLCLYCMVVWAVTIPAAVLIFARNVVRDLIKVTPRTKMIITTAAWPTIIVLYLIIGASILLRFGEAMF